MVSRSDKLAVHSYPLLYLQRQVAKVACGLLCWWSFLRNNNMATNLQTFTSCRVANLAFFKTDFQNLAFFGNQSKPDKIWLFWLILVGKIWLWQNIV